jgi:hypothetical protein
MIGNNDLETLAKKAKEQLQEQIGGTSEEQNVNSDMVEDYTQENIELQNKPSGDYEENRPKLFPYDEPLFVGGPTKTQIDSWKKQWTGYDIYAIEVIGQYFIFRTLNRFEYKQLVAEPDLDPLQREEIICETVTLWPRAYKWDKMAIEKAGIPSTYAQIIMDKSGFTKEYSIQVL